MSDHTVERAAAQWTSYWMDHAELFVLHWEAPEMVQRRLVRQFEVLGRPSSSAFQTMTAILDLADSYQYENWMLEGYDPDMLVREGLDLLGEFASLLDDRLHELGRGPYAPHNAPEEADGEN